MRSDALRQPHLLVYIIATFRTGGVVSPDLSNLGQKLYTYGHTGHARGRNLHVEYLRIFFSHFKSIVSPLGQIISFVKPQTILMQLAKINERSGCNAFF